MPLTLPPGRRIRHSTLFIYPLAAVCLLAASLLTAQSASAASRICQSDPVLVVNGSVVDVVSTLSADPSAISELDYTVSVPAGSLLGGLTLTAGLGFPEKVTYVFSPTQHWGSIGIAASVVTQPGTAPFPVKVSVTTLLGSATASGSSTDTLSAWVKPLLML